MTKVLYVEDEIFLAKIVKESLESRGYEVIHIDDGSCAMDAFRSQQVDICILDIMLPKLSGFDIAQNIREINKAIPILFLTAKDQPEDVIKGFEIGGNDYIKKPFSMKELILRIKNLLQLTQNNLKESSMSEEIPIGDMYRFSLSKMTLYDGEKHIQLSHKENQIVTLLSRHQNKTVLRQDILMAVWADDSFYNSRTLDVYIRKIRAHFSQDNRIQIVTLRGTGYRFMVES